MHTATHLETQSRKTHKLCWYFLCGNLSSQRNRLQVTPSFRFCVPAAQLVVLAPGLREQRRAVAMVARAAFVAIVRGPTREDYSFEILDSDPLGLVVP